jgi:hypothetical protein
MRVNGASLLVLALLGGHCLLAAAYIFPDKLSPAEYKQKLDDYKFKIQAHGDRDFKKPGVDGCGACKKIVNTLWAAAETTADGPQEPDLRAVIAFFHEEWDLHHHLEDHHVDKIKLHPLYTRKKLTKDFCGDYDLKGIARMCNQAELDQHDEL